MEDDRNMTEINCWDCKIVISSDSSCVLIGIPELPFEQFAIMCPDCADKRSKIFKEKYESKVN